MRLVCDHCCGRQVGSREPLYIECERYDEWVSHMLTKGHQAKVCSTFMTWKEWEDKNSIVVTMDSPALTPLDVLHYFSKFGMVAEFYHSREMKFCVLRIDHIVPNGKAWQHGDVLINGQAVKIYEKTTMTNTDWEALNATRNGSVTDTETVQKKHDRRVFTAPAMQPSSKVGKLPQAEIVVNHVGVGYNQSGEERGSQSQGTSQGSSVTSNGFERLTEKKKARSRKKNKRDGEREKRKENTGMIGKTEPTISAAAPENQEVSKKSEDSQVQKKEEVQFRGGFNIGPRPFIVPSPASDFPQPLPQHHQVPPTVSNILLNSQRFQVQTPSHIQQVGRPQAPPQNRYNQDMIRPPQRIPNMQMQQPRFYQYGQRMPNMPYHEAQQFSQQRSIHPVLPPGAFPNNSQNPRQRYPPVRNEPLPKFINLFYQMVNDPIGVRRSPLCEDFEKLNLKDQFREFLSALSLDEGRKHMRDGMLRDLQKILSMEYPYCSVYAFGSYLTGLGDLESDVDVYIDAFGVTHGRQLPKNESSTLDVLNRCQKVLRRAKCPQSNRAFCNQLIPIREARVPILKLKHSLTSVNCDLSFENLISVRNSELILLYMRLHPVVRPLIILIRYWGKFHSLTGSNNIKNYGLILLVLVFLGNKQIVPTIASLQSLQETQRRKSMKSNINVKNPDIIDGWDCSFCDNVEVIKSVFQSSLSLEEAGSNLVRAVGKLAEEFFEFYANADLSTSTVCSYTSELLPKSQFSAGNEEDLPATLDRYKEWSYKQTSERRLNIKTPLCIQDPFILSFNVGAVTPHGILLKFQVGCAQTSKHLNDSKFVSLIDAFIPLPKEIGDSKFMGMQKKQRVTKELSREINHYVSFGTDIDVSENTDTQEEETPLHLLPIDKIIHKNTVRFGKGWESYSNFQPDREFQKLFVQEIKICRLNDFHSPRFLLQKLKVLWIGFVEDFLREIWNKCFQLEVTQEERVKFERMFADPPFAVRTRKNYENIFSEREKKDKKNNPKVELDLERVERMKMKLLDLEELVERIMYKKITCTVTNPIWQSRDKVFKQAVGNLTRSNTKGSPAEAEETVAEAKKNLKKKKKVKRVEGNIDPLDIEAEVTKMLLENFKSDTVEETLAKKPILKFVALIKFDVSLVDELPEIFFIYEKAEGPKASYDQGVSTFADIVSNALPEYLIYRLRNWLGQGNEAAEPTSESVGNLKTETEEELVNTDTTYDDLLMPPSSSSSECSESPVLVDVEF